MSDKPDIVKAVAVWHPKLKYGHLLEGRRLLPVLYSSVAEAEAILTLNGLWPLKHEWQLVQVSIVPEIGAHP